MKVVRLSISNFRGVKSAKLLFDGHTLMVGSNNVGKGEGGRFGRYLRCGAVQAPEALRGLV